MAMTLQEAERIARELLPGEPGGDALASWRASMPRPEPAKPARGLDTAPAIDWALVIRMALKSERAHVLEVVGAALGENNNDILDQVEALIAQAADQIKSELRAEFAKQIDGLRAELAAGFAIHGAKLRSELEAIIAAKKARRARAQAAKPNGSTSSEHLLLPAPNGSNGDGRQPQ
jgi:hypothetical protein